MGRYGYLKHYPTLTSVSKPIWASGFFYYVKISKGRYYCKNRTIAYISYECVKVFLYIQIISMHNKKHKKSGFTLIEMLIVIVIIGILASALIPRLNSARGRANDVARKADLQQIATALISYQIDSGRFPPAGGTLSTIEAELSAGGMASVPKDPGNATVLNWGYSTGENWEFLYQPITKNGQRTWWIVLMASVETEWSANYVVCSGGLNAISGGTTFETVQSRICTSFSTTGSCSTVSSWACYYTKSAWELRYIYVY